MSRELFLYSRNHCAPCREMQQRLAELLDGRDCDCHVISIDGIPDLEIRYGSRVPVLVAGNRELCALRLDPHAVLSFLEQQPAGRRTG